MSIKIRKAPFFRLSKHAGLVLFGSPCHHYYPQLWQASLRHFHLRPGAIITAQSPLLKHESSRTTERERRSAQIVSRMPKKGSRSARFATLDFTVSDFFPSEKKPQFLPPYTFAIRVKRSKLQTFVTRFFKGGMRNTRHPPQGRE